MPVAPVPITALPVTALQVYGLPVYGQLRTLLQATMPERVARLPATAAEVKQRGAMHTLSRQLRQLLQHNPDQYEQILTEIDTSPSFTTSVATYSPATSAVNVGFTTVASESSSL